MGVSPLLQVETCDQIWQVKVLRFKWNLAQKSSMKRRSYCVNSRKSSHVDYFFSFYFCSFWGCLYNFNQGNLSNVSRKAYGCDPWNFIFASMYYDVVDLFQTRRKSLISTQKKYVYFYHRSGLECFLGGCSVTCG